MHIHLLGVPMDLGAGRRGVDMGPSAIRIAGVSEKLRALGHQVTDGGDVTIKTPERQRIRDPKLRYVSEIARVCTVMGQRIERTLNAGGFPLIIGGDHSIAIGSVMGMAAHANRRKKRLGILWVDAHGDMNTEATTPSGNIHGMPLAASLGYGAAELTQLGGFSPKIRPEDVVMIGIRSLDEGERKLIREAGIQVFTMEDIDKQGMAWAISRALRRLRNVDMLHVSFDLDAVDPSVAPGVGTPVKGGLDYREAHLIMETVHESGKMSSLELVEANPILDDRNTSAEFAAELIQSAFGKKIL